MRKIIIQLIILVLLVSLLFIIKPSIVTYFPQRNFVSTSTVEISSTTQSSNVKATTTADTTWYRMFGKDEQCAEGYSPSVIMLVSEGAGEERRFCNLTSTIQEGPRLIGTGKEAYSLEGYYYEYGHEFYPLDYDPQRDKGYPKIIPCKAFVVTGGDQAFIDAYREQIQSKFPPKDAKVIINLNYLIRDRYGANIDAPSFITSSTEENPIVIKLMVHSFPERDASPCDSYGLYIPEDYLFSILSDQDYVWHTFNGSDYKFRVEYPLGFKTDYAHNSPGFELKIIDPKSDTQYLRILMYSGDITDNTDWMGPYPKIIPPNTKNGELTVVEEIFNGISGIHVTGVVEEGFGYANYFVFQRGPRVWVIDFNPVGKDMPEVISPTEKNVTAGFRKDIYMRIKDSFSFVK